MTGTTDSYLGLYIFVACVLPQRKVTRHIQAHSLSACTEAVGYFAANYLAERLARGRTAGIAQCSAESFLCAADGGLAV